MEDVEWQSDWVGVGSWTRSTHNSVLLKADNLKNLPSTIVTVIQWYREKEVIRGGKEGGCLGCK